jgi:hypothetical protein
MLASSEAFRQRILLTLLATILAAGCSEKKTPANKLTIEGQVTVKGKPVRAGIIKFVSEAGEVWSDDVRNGKFTIANVIPSKCTVSLEPAAEPGKSPEKVKDIEYTIVANQVRIEIKFP